MERLLYARRRWHIALLGVLTLAMALPGLGSIPLLDRDEARYAQASVQMVESGDPVEIRLGEEARNQKPAGAYWAQAGAILATGGLAAQPGTTLAAQRLPSVAAAVIAVWLTYAAALPMVGRAGALLAGAMLATSLIFAFEAHIAKTDALLLSSTSAMFAALSRLRASRARGMAFLFWGALGASVLIKGPVGPAIAILSVLALLAWERKAAWARPLLNPLAMLLGAAIALPWFVAIGLATDGQFFADSLGRDFGGKLAGAAENHGGPPGYYLATVWLSLWPASLVLVPGAVFAWQAARRGGDAAPARGMRLVVAWVVPFWVVLEFTPTKLIHYPLPLFPALCIAMAGAVLAVAGGNAFLRSRWIGALVFLVASAVVIGTVLAVQVGLGDPAWTVPALAVGAVSGALALAACLLLFTARARRAVVAAVASALPLSLLAYGALIPRVEAGRVSERLARLAPPPVVSPDYTETSLLYYAGTGRVVAEPEWDNWSSWAEGSLIVARDGDVQRAGDTSPGLQAVVAAAAARGLCLSERGAVEGVNYSRGETVSLVVLGQVACDPAPAPTAPR